MSTPLKFATQPKVVCLDIETGRSAEAEIERRIAEWQPPANCRKEETIEARRQDFAKTAREQSALWDSAPILAVAMATAQGVVGFECMTGGQAEPKDRHGNTIIRAGDERGMLVAMREFLAGWFDAETGAVVVGHNLRGFDLPKLRLAYLRHRLALPQVLCVVHDDDDELPVRIADVMTLFARHFSLDNRPDAGKVPFVSFSRVMQYLGLPEYPAGFEGANVPDWHEQGRYDLVMDKAVVDARDEYRAYMLLASRDPELV